MHVPIFLVPPRILLGKEIFSSYLGKICTYVTKSICILFWCIWHPMFLSILLYFWNSWNLLWSHWVSNTTLNQVLYDYNLFGNMWWHGPFTSYMQIQFWFVLFPVNYVLTWIFVISIGNGNTPRDADKGWQNSWCLLSDTNHEVLVSDMLMHEEFHANHVEACYSGHIFILKHL